jgi:hypothetical protein
MEQNTTPSQTEEEPLRPQVVDDGEEPADDNEPGTYITEPSKLIRIASMTRAMLEEVRQSPLDEAGRLRLLHIYEASLHQLRDTLSDDLQEELASIFQPLQEETASESELRIVQAQLVGWLEGLFHGIQASLFSQQVSAAYQLEEMRRRHALEAARDEESRSSGLYL